MKWDDLPRDLQLQVIKRFDMDTRIRLGLVFKLHIPDHIKQVLRNKLKRPHDCEHYSLVPLGKRRIHASYDIHFTITSTLAVIRSGKCITLQGT